MSMDGQRFRSGDLVTVKGEPPASGEVIACAESIGKVRVQFQGLACWLDVQHLELLAAGQDAPRAAEGVR